MKKSLLSMAIAAYSFAASASDNWQTIQTEHFQIHFPEAYQAWANSAANELELVRKKVLEQQNRSLEQPIDVVVFDPYNQSNGFAIPSSTIPMMALFATPPQSDTVISNSSGWQQLLVLHEYVHLVHLAQPTRSEWRQSLRQISDLYDLTHNPTPRWVAEGYATLLESQMTGRGRLHDNYVESLIIQFAKEGMLPSYGQLNATDGGYLAGSMAYLMGVRFLQWLEDKYSKKQVDAIWTRMQAVEKRDFNQAFIGIFNEKPQKLYRRFVAEYHHKALSLEAQQPTLDTALWFDLNHIQQAPNLSPNEDKLAIVSRDKKGNTKLTLYATSDNEKALDTFEKDQKELLENDPKDIPDTAPSVFKRKSKHVLNAINGKGIMNPQWLNDDTLVYGAFSIENNAQNTLHQDLFKWNSKTGQIDQLTEFANIRRFTLVDNNTAIAERVRYGQSQLVNVDLSSGEVTTITDASLDSVYDFPKYSHGKLAYLKTSLNENWTLNIRDLSSDRIFSVPMPKGYQFLSYPEWSTDGTSIYYVAGVAGQTNLYRYTFANDTLEQLSHGQHVIQFPMTSEKHGLLYMAVNSEGPDIYQLAESAKATVVLERTESKHASTDKAQTHVLPPAQIYQQSIGQRGDYKATNQAMSFALGEQYNSASTTVLHLGVKGKDILNQLSWQLGGAFDTKDVLSGAYFDAKYKMDKWQFSGHGYDYTLSSENQYQHPDTLGIEEKSTGFLLAASYPYRNGAFKLDTQLAVGYKDNDRNRNEWLALSAKQIWQRDWQKFAIGQTLSTTLYSGSVRGKNWDGFDLNAQVFGKAWSMPLYLGYQSKQRNDMHLSIGGFASSLIKQAAHSDYALIQELPFYTQLTDDYQSYDMGFAFKQGAPWLYVAEHHSDNKKLATSYGVKWQTTFDFALAPALLNDIKIDFGIAQLESDYLQEEIRGWLGVWYSL